MTDPRARVLRVTGVPREMASAAIDALLSSSRGVLSIDAVEPSLDDPQMGAVHVLVEEAEVDRVRKRIFTAFADVGVEDVTDARAAGHAPAKRIRAGLVSRDSPGLALEPMKRGGELDDG